MASFKPKISVLILTYNQAQFIESTLSSVVSQESDKYELEVILTDDGSSDDTVDRVRRFKERSPIPIKIIAKEHEGVHAIASNFLAMINMADADYVSFLAGDDQYTDNRFIKQLDSFEKDPNLVISYADGVNCINGAMGMKCHSEEVVELLSNSDSETVYKYLTSRTPIIFIQSTLAKLNFLKEIQPFDCDLIADDWVFNIKVFGWLKGTSRNFNYEPSVVFVRNIHGENTSRNLIVHYQRISQVANRYCVNGRSVKTKFIASAIFSALQKRQRSEIEYFVRQLIFYPESTLRFTYLVVTRAIVALQRRLRT